MWLTLISFEVLLVGVVPRDRQCPAVKLQLSRVDHREQLGHHVLLSLLKDKYVHSLLNASDGERVRAKTPRNTGRFHGLIESCMKTALVSN